MLTPAPERPPDVAEGNEEVVLVFLMASVPLRAPVAERDPLEKSGASDEASFWIEEASMVEVGCGKAQVNVALHGQNIADTHLQLRTSNVRRLGVSSGGSDGSSAGVASGVSSGASRASSRRLSSSRQLVCDRLGQVRAGGGSSRLSRRGYRVCR